MSLVYQTASNGSARRNSIYIGSKSDAKSVSKLERWNVTHILNVTPEKEAGIQAGVPNYFEKKSLKINNRRLQYKRIPVYDVSASAVDLESHADEIVSYVSSALFHGSVLVHCHHGVSRSTACVMMYLMRKANMSVDEALATIQQRRPQAQPIPAFMDMLRRFEKTIQREHDDEGPPSKRARTVGPTRPPSSVKGPAKGPGRGPSMESTQVSDIGPSIGIASKKPIGSTAGPSAEKLDEPTTLTGPPTEPRHSPKEENEKDTKDDVAERESSAFEPSIGPEVPDPKPPI